jgi:MSHA biogenesis protein MshL
MQARSLLIAAAVLLPLHAAAGQGAADLDRILGLTVDSFVADGEEARTVLQGIGAAYHFPLVVDPDVQGSVSFEMHNATVAALLDTVCQARGWSWSVSGRGFLLVRRFVTRIYPVDYLQMSGSGSSSASINLSESAGTSGSLPGGPVPAQAAQAAMAPGAQPESLSGGTSTLSVSQQNDADFWGRLESDLKAMVGEGESLLVNRFAGLVQVRGSSRTQAVVESYLRRVLQRVGRQARISVKVVEVDLNNQSKLGIDWSAAGASLGRIAGTSITLAGASTSTGALAQAGPIALAQDTFTGTISAGGVGAVLSALSEQGTVRIESKPEIAALNNQTAFVQVSEDQPFFSRTSTTTINAGGTPQAGTQPIVSTNYSQSTVSFGNVLEITVQIADDLSTKVSLSPAMTELKGTVTSPDGQETAPITDTKRARTTLVLRNHETAVVGGFITETVARDKRGLPGLSSAPFIGRAFTTSVTARSRAELVFLVTVNAQEPPDLVPVDADSPAPAGGRQGAPARPAVERVDATGALS